MKGLPSNSKLARFVVTKPDLAAEVTFVVGDGVFMKAVPLPGKSCGLAVDGSTKSSAYITRETKHENWLSMVNDEMVK